MTVLNSVDTIGQIPWKQALLTSEYSDVSHISDDTRGIIPWKQTLPPIPLNVLTPQSFCQTSSSSASHHLADDYISVPWKQKSLVTSEYFWHPSHTIHLSKERHLTLMLQQKTRVGVSTSQRTFHFSRITAELYLDWEVMAACSFCQECEQNWFGNWNSTVELCK